MFKLIINFLSRILYLHQLHDKANLILINQGILLGVTKNLNEKKFINDFEFKIFSQFGDDGLIDFIIEDLNIKNKIFVEFGVEDYEESNTRFLLEAKSWSGLIIDSSQDNINNIKKKNYFWRNKIKPICSFVTKNNINSIIKNNNVSGEVGLLSIDIDGNDYWIWNEINIIDPCLVVIEYNARLGSSDSITIPYQETFMRKKSGYELIYYGASLHALYKLGLKKGYELIGTNKNGNNAYFAKKSIISNSKSKIIKPLKPKDCFHLNSFTELRDKNGKIIDRDPELEKNILNKMSFVEI